MNANELKSLTKEQLIERLSQVAEQQASGLTVKFTDKGGVYIRHASFVEFSENKGKSYTAGINMGAATAFALFGNPKLLEQVAKAVVQLREQAKAASK